MSIKIFKNICDKEFDNVHGHDHYLVVILWKRSCARKIVCRDLFEVLPVLTEKIKRRVHKTAGFLIAVQKERQT